MKRLLGALTFILAGSAVAVSADTYPRQPNVEVSHYRFALTLGDDTDDVRGEATVDVRLLTAGIPDVDLDLVQPSAGRNGTGMTVSSVTCEDRPCPYLHRSDRLRISLPSPTTAGQLVRITVVYHGIPATGLIIGPNKHGDRTFFSDNWPNKAHQWLPVIDHVSDKATCEFSIDAPAHYQVISNGLKIEETDLPDGRRRTVWRQSVPISPWLYALGVAPFAVQRVGEYGHVPIETWVYAQDRDAGFYDFAVPARDVMAFFSTWIGPFAYEKLANVQANSVRGGMESASNIFYGPDSVTGTRTKRWRNVIIHEIAHQWFGNAVTESDWDDVWLSEGFATYFTLLYVEHAYGRDEFVDGLRSSRKSVLEFNATHPDYRIVHDNLSDMKDVTTPQTYQKGAWTLHMLRGVMGDDKFWAGIRGYYRRYRDTVASTADFRRAMEEAAGSDLRWFFDEWLYRGGLPKIEGGWHYDPAAKRIEIELNQRQPGPAFRMRVDIAIMTPGVETRTERVQIGERTNAFSIPSDQPPASIMIDPDVWALMDVSFSKR